MSERKKGHKDTDPAPIGATPCPPDCVLNEETFECECPVAAGKPGAPLCPPVPGGRPVSILVEIEREPGPGYSLRIIYRPRDAVQYLDNAPTQAGNVRQNRAGRWFTIVSINTLRPPSSVQVTAEFHGGGRHVEACFEITP